MIDPIKLLIEKASAGNNHVALAGSVVADESPFEIPLVPPPGAKVKHMTVASTYRNPIPILFESSSRTCFPIPNDR